MNSAEIIQALLSVFPLVVPEAILGLAACVLFLGATFRGDRQPGASLPCWHWRWRPWPWRCLPSAWRPWKIAGPSSPAWTRLKDKPAGTARPWITPAEARRRSTPHVRQPPAADPAGPADQGARSVGGSGAGAVQLERGAGRPGGRISRLPADHRGRPVPDRRGQRTGHAVPRAGTDQHSDLRPPLFAAHRRRCAGSGDEVFPAEHLFVGALAVRLQLPVRPGRHDQPHRP